MTIDETILAAALRDLAGTVADEPRRVELVHQRARRLRRRRHAAGASVVAAALAATLVGAESLRGSGRGSPLAGPATPTAGVAGPACQTKPPLPAQAGAPTGPAIGEAFTGAGRVVGTPGSASVTLDVQGGPLAGSSLTLAITAATRVFVPASASGDPSPEVPSSAAQLRDGQAVKFSATRAAVKTIIADQIHAGVPADSSATGADGAPASKPAAPTQTPPPPAPAVTQRFKAHGVVVAATGRSLTVKIDSGNLDGTVTFAMSPGATTCQPGPPHPGDHVLVAGTRTGPVTYQADLVAVTPTPAVAPAPATRPGA